MRRAHYICVQMTLRCGVGSACHASHLQGLVVLTYDEGRPPWGVLYGHSMDCHPNNTVLASPSCLEMGTELWRAPRESMQALCGGEQP